MSIEMTHSWPIETNNPEQDEMTNFKANDKALKAARAAVNRLTFGTAEWEAAMQVVRELVEKENSSDNAILNHRCDFSR